MPLKTCTLCKSSDVQVFACFWYGGKQGKETDVGSIIILSLYLRSGSLSFQIFKS